MNNLKYVLYTLLVLLFFTGCYHPKSTPSDLEPLIKGRFKDCKTVHYPSTDSKVCAIIVDKHGDVWYLRMNAVGDMRDDKLLFNLSEYCD